MSRIEEALRRAHAGATVSGEGKAVASPKPGGSVPAPELFQDPWTMEPGSTEEPTNEVEETPPAPQPTPTKRSSSVWETLLDAAPSPGASVPGAETASVDADQATPPAPSAAAGPAIPADGVTEGQPAASPGLPPQGLALFQGFNPAVVEKIVATPDIRPIFAEQYRKLAGVLHHAQLERDLKVVMITSAVAGEGKTLTATNLALTFSESYRRSVLLIDADLRRPTLHETFQVPNVAGLGDGLRADKEEKLPVVQVSPRLTLLTAGRPDPDPMSGLTSARMRRVIEEARSRFDWVIVDTPRLACCPTPSCSRPWPTSRFWSYMQGALRIRWSSAPWPPLAARRSWVSS